MKKLLLSVFILVGWMSSHAQSGYFGGFGFFEPGAMYFDAGPLNTLLEANGYSTIDPLHYASGGSGFVLINNFVIGGRGGGFSEQNVTRPGTSGRFSGGYGNFSFGYAVPLGYKQFIVPTVGIGGMYTNLQLESDAATTSLNDALANPLQVVNLRSSSAMIDASVSYFTRVGRGGDEQSGGGFAIGLVAGAWFSPSNADFTLNQRAVTEVVDFRPNGFYLTLKIGGGGYGRARE
ncbi:MAG: hypothetical protein ACFCUH_02210 [Flavobacteriales bacterium]